ncbi:uncharacterized protein [Leptinotarsa decemlineata]|uniref:uncharacterized protein n=1 Tax=Leptinotarsa decemlineata TaxID=7539 RepID=UPI003D304116
MTKKAMLYYLLLLIPVIHGIKYSHHNLYGAEKIGCFSNICWDNHSYPIEKINQKMSESNLEDTVGYLDGLETVQKPLGSCSMCNMILNMQVKPLSIIEEGKKYFIIHSRNYKQTEITLNVCSIDQSNSNCKNGWIPLDHEKECRQKSTSMTVLAYDETKNEFVGKTFSYPSACECIVKSIY